MLSAVKHLIKYGGKYRMKGTTTSQGLTCDLQCVTVLYRNKKITGSIRTFWYKGFAPNKAERKCRIYTYICVYHKQQIGTNRMIYQNRILPIDDQISYIRHRIQKRNKTYRAKHFNGHCYCSFHGLRSPGRGHDEDAR